MKYSWKRILSVFLVLALILGSLSVMAFAEGDDPEEYGGGTYDDPVDPEPEPEPEPIREPLELELSRGTIDIGEGGDAYLMASVSGGSGSYSYIWKSSNNSIVQAIGNDSNCEIYALKAGEATITVTVNDGSESASDSCVVHVTAIGKNVTYNVSENATAGKGVDFSGIVERIAASYQKQVGESLDYSAITTLSITSNNIGSIQYQDGTVLTAGSKYQFSSLYSTVFFQPRTAGTFTTRYTVTAGENTISGTITINVKASASSITGVSLNTSSITMDTYSNRNLSVSVRPADASYTISWKTSNSNIATVRDDDEIGTVSTKGRAGSCTITVTVKDAVSGSTYDRSCTVTVRDSGGSGSSSSSSYNPGLTVTAGSEYYGTTITDSLANEFYNRFGVALNNSATVRFSSLNTTYGRLILQNGSNTRTSTNYTFGDLKSMVFEPIKAGTWSGDYTLTYYGYTLSGTIYFYVKGSSVSVSLNSNNISLAPYSNQYLYATVSPNSYSRAVWSTSNSSLVTVTGNGTAATVSSFGRTGTATVSLTVTDYSGIQTTKSCTVTVTNANSGYSPSMSTYIGNTTKGTTIYDSLRNQFRNVYGVTPGDNATIRFSDLGDSKIAVRKLSNGRAISANTNYTLGDYKGMYTDPVSAGTFSTPYTLTYNNNTLTGTITVNISPAPVNVSLALKDANPYSFSTLLSTGTGSAQISGAVNGALNSASAASWSYIRFTTPGTIVGTLYQNSSRATLYNTTNVTPAMFEQLTFVPAQAGTFTTELTVYNNSGAVVGKGALSIVVPGTAPANSSGLRVQITSQVVTCNGKTIDTEVYNINGANYFKLRDLAAMLNGTGSQFAVGYDNATRTITVNTGLPYTMLGTELVKGVDKSSTCVTNPMSVFINGVAVNLQAYNIGGSTFFQLRELGNSLGFGVGYDEATRTVLITSR